MKIQLFNPENIGTVDAVANSGAGMPVLRFPNGHELLLTNTFQFSQNFARCF